MQNTGVEVGRGVRDVRHGFLLLEKGKRRNLEWE